MNSILINKKVAGSIFLVLCLAAVDLAIDIVNLPIANWNLSTEEEKIMDILSTS